MTRRKTAPKRNILPDPLFRSSMLAKFINTVMKSGKKSVAERIVYGALDKVMESQNGTVTKAKSVKRDRDRDRDRDGGDGGDAGGVIRYTGTIRDSDSARDAALEIFKQALENVTPLVEVKSRRVGGSTYQVPVEIRAERRRTLAMRWLTEFASERNEKTMVLRLASEIMDAVAGRGGAVKKRDDVHRMAKANQAFAHYRW